MMQMEILKTDNYIMWMQVQILLITTSAFSPLAAAMMTNLSSHRINLNAKFSIGSMNDES